MPFRLILLAILGMFAATLAAHAQDDLFQPAIYVDGRAVTRYELDQRMRFLEVLRVPGDLEEQARRGLVEDRLRFAAAEAADIAVSPEELQQGMAEFAGRANLEVAQFLEAISQAGVAPETFRDFVGAGIAWRTLVRGRYADRIIISEAEIDRAMAVTANRGAGPRVLLSEIIIPVPPGSGMRERDLAQRLYESITSSAAFAEAARQHSAAPSRDQGGRLDWMPLTNLPPAARNVALGMQPGQVTPPVPLVGAIGLFQIHDIRDAGEIENRNITVEFAQVNIPGGQTATALAEAARISATAKSCDEIFGAAARTPGATVSRETRTLPQLPQDVAAVLARLDEGETSTALARPGVLTLLMLCRRVATIAEGGAPVADPQFVAPEGAPLVDDTLGFGAGPTRAQMRDELVSQRLVSLADLLMAELRANAIIRTP